MTAGALSRVRLFNCLKHESLPHTWIVGPPGSGKTTLIASFLEKTACSYVWYRADSGDGDLAGFIHQFVLAVQGVGRHREIKLPLLTPEYQAGIPAFTVRFFELLADYLPSGITLVFDDYHEIPADSPTHEFLAAGMRTLTRDVHIVIVSRQNPGECFSRLRIEQKLGVIDWEMLQCTREETLALVRHFSGKRGLSHKTIANLHDYTRGWIAGLILALTAGVEEGQVFNMKDAGQATFDYFFSEVFKHLDESSRNVLLHVSALPDFTPAMIADLGKKGGQKPLEGLLCEMNFIQRHEGAPVRYSLHPMFRSFLRDFALKNLAQDEFNGIQKHAADLLLLEDRYEQAVPLYVAIHDWEVLIRLIGQNGPGMLDQGRHEVLAGWINLIPSALRNGNPWLLFYLGACRFPFDHDESRVLLSDAYQRFLAQGDLTGQILSWALIVDGIVFAWTDFSLLDEWLACAERDLIPVVDALPPGPIQARLIAGIFNILMFRRLEDPQIEVWAERLEQILKAVEDPSQRILAGMNLAFYYNAWIGDTRRASRILDTMRPLPKDKHVMPMAQITWHFIMAVHYVFLNRLEEAAHELEAGRNLSLRTGMHLWDFYLQIGGVYERLSAGDIKGAQVFLKVTEKIVTPKRPLEYSHNAMMVAWADFLDGDYISSATIAHSCLHASEHSGTSVQLAHNLIQLAAARWFQGRRDGIIEMVRRALTLAENIRSAILAYSASLLLAGIYFDSNREEEGLDSLRHAFALAREYVLVNYSFMCGKILAPLYKKALESDIEIETVRQLVREHCPILPSLPSYPVKWPWGLRIYTLGRFEMFKDDELLQSDGKAQRKPIELLQALVALGGREVREERLSENLWPDATGDAAHSAFTTTLSRLRKLVGERVIAVSGGRVSLDLKYCWLDLWEIDQLIKLSESVSSADEKREITRRIFDLYQGPFLGQDADESWAISSCDRLRSKMARFITKRGNELNDANKWEDAILLYQSAIEIDRLVEPFHQGLMRAYVKLGRHAEACAAFDRYRKFLLKFYGMEPSLEMHALAKSICKQ